MATPGLTMALSSEKQAPARSRLAFWPAIAWACVIFMTSSTVITTKQFVKGVASNAVVHVSQSGFDLFWRHYWWVFVKGYHMLEYLLLTLLVNKGIAARSNWSFSVRLGTAWIAAALYAVSDEFHQTYVPGRGGLPTDVLIDSTGAALAVLIIVGLERRSLIRK